VTRAGVLLLVALAGGTACDREARRFQSDAVAATTNPYGANAYGLNQGKTLFTWYNCVGCHSNGGGGMGPPLMDGRWLYGSRPEDVFASIAEGRPNGMPAFGGRVPDDQIWQLVAYVRAMSGHVRKDAAPGRADAMQVWEPELLREPEPLAPDDPP
jgi:cytochrome c oxidase cbb3-type subunit III